MWNYTTDLGAFFSTEGSFGLRIQITNVMRENSRQETLAESQSASGGCSERGAILFPFCGSPDRFSWSKIQRHTPAEWNLREIVRFSVRFWREILVKFFALDTQILERKRSTQKISPKFHA